MRSTAPAIQAATPLIDQVRQLVSEPELRGLVSDLRPTIPDLARLTARTQPFLSQARSRLELLQRGRHPLVERLGRSGAPATRTRVNGTVAEETGYGLVGIAGESRSGDANGQYIRVEAGGGANTIIQPSFPGQTDDPSRPAGRPARLPAEGRDAGARRLAEDSVQARRGL